MTPGLARLGEVLELRVAPRLYQHTRVLTPSPSSRAEIIERLGLPAANVTAVPNGVDERFQPGGDRDHRIPGSSRSAASSCTSTSSASSPPPPVARQSVPDLELVIVGQGYERPNIERVIDDLDARDWVHLRGHVPRRRPRRPPAVGVGHRQRVLRRGMGAVAHRGRRVRHPGGRHPHRRATSTACATARPDCSSASDDELAHALAGGAHRRRAAAAPRRGRSPVGGVAHAGTTSALEVLRAIAEGPIA